MWTRTDDAHVLTDKHSLIHLIVLLDYPVDCNRGRDLASKQSRPHTLSEVSLKLRRLVLFHQKWVVIGSALKRNKVQHI